MLEGDGVCGGDEGNGGGCERRQRKGEEPPDDVNGWVSSRAEGGELLAVGEVGLQAGGEGKRAQREGGVGQEKEAVEGEVRYTAGVKGRGGGGGGEVPTPCRRCQLGSSPQWPHGSGQPRRHRPGLPELLLKLLDSLF